MSYTPYFAFGGAPPAMGLLESLAGRTRNSGKFYSAQCLITEGEMAVRRQGMNSPCYSYE